MSGEDLFKYDTVCGLIDRLPFAFHVCISLCHEVKALLYSSRWVYLLVVCTM